MLHDGFCRFFFALVKVAISERELSKKGYREIEKAGLLLSENLLLPRNMSFKPGFLNQEVVIHPFKPAGDVEGDEYSSKEEEEYSDRVGILSNERTKVEIHPNHSSSSGAVVLFLRHDLYMDHSIFRDYSFGMGILNSRCCKNQR